MLKIKKSDAQSLRISDFNYNLTEDRISKYPLANRSSSKLLQYNNQISTHQFDSIHKLIPEDSLMIFNNTRVIHARLFFQKQTGAVIEIFCLSPNEPNDYQANFQQTEKVVWNCMIGNSKRWRDGTLHYGINTDKMSVNLFATKISKSETDNQVEFSWDNPNYTFSDILDEVGRLPIPPYLNRESEDEDDETYQTVYSSIEGSVAAPTAGLHFTPEVISLLHSKNILTDYVTLHVGAGTFKPIKSETVEEHRMHSEFIIVSRGLIESLINNIDKIVVVGTTSLRTIESLYYIGKQIYLNPTLHSSRFFVTQWEPYDEVDPISPKQALEAIIVYLEKHNEAFIYAETGIFIVPGYQFHYPIAVVTNFHQPQSTLLLLIAAFIGSDWKRVYDYALINDYRFLSYGDGSLLWRK